jgi:hypothetical protein
MSVTRFRSDHARLAKEAEISTYSGRYFLDTPGQGVNMPFIEDVHVRLQSWGGNWDGQHFLDIENDLRGTSRKLRNDGSHRTYKYTPATYRGVSAAVPIMQPFVDETRASQPAWMLRDWDNAYARWEQPWLDPQSELHTQRWTSLDSKRAAKDAYRPPSSMSTTNTNANQQDFSIEQMTDFVDAWFPKTQIAK